jgi:hypothetical protein
MLFNKIVALSLGTKARLQRGSKLNQAVSAAADPYGETCTLKKSWPQLSTSQYCG